MACDHGLELEVFLIFLPCQVAEINYKYKKNNQKNKIMAVNKGKSIISNMQPRSKTFCLLQGVLKKGKIAMIRIK